MKKSILYITLIFIFMGCSRDIPTPTKRLHVAQDIANVNNLQSQVIKTSTFDIFSYQKLLTCKEVMSVYIEGDGFAWVTSSIISDNPTPINPMSLKLMAQDDSTCKVYLARPCQYTNDSTCKEKYWTSHRFSQEIIKSYIEVLDKLKKEYKLSSFELYGYSGGGAVAALLSAKRKDVTKLVTIAGNLDVEYWTKKHYLTPLKGSLNPADYADVLESIKQYHFIGQDDGIIDESIYKSYASKFKNKDNLRYKIIENNTHSKGWEKSWKKLLKETD